MADYINRVEVDVSFLLGKDGYTDSKVSFVAQGLNFKGYRNIFNDIFFEEAAPSFYDILVNFQTNSLEPKTIDRVLAITIEDSVEGWVDDHVQYFVVESTTSGTLNNYIAYNLPSPPSNFFKTFITQYTAAREFLLYNNIPTTLVLLSSGGDTLDFVGNYTNYTGYNDFYFNPLPSWDGSIDIETFYTSFSGAVIGWDSEVDISFAGWVPYNTYLDAFCSENFFNSIMYDTFLTPGGKDGVLLDCFASSPDMVFYPLDLYCSVTAHVLTHTHILLISGSKYGVGTDLYSSYDNRFMWTSVDVDIFPIYFDNFSLNVGDYTNVSGSICLDAHDGLYTLLSSGTYLKINNTQVTTTLIELLGGYRLYYDPEDDFYSLSGVTKFTAHAENNHGDVLEEDFYLTFGYIVEFDNINNIGFNYGYANRVSVRVEAENLASCPIKVSEGYWFVSEERNKRDLTACIFSHGAVKKEAGDLKVIIYPHSTAYFYDKEIRVVLTAKDFNGNNMEPFVLEFKIINEDQIIS